MSGKTWLKNHSKYLAKYQDRATTANMDSERLILSICQNAYGVNIGDEVFAQLTLVQKTKIIDFLKWSV